MQYAVTRENEVHSIQKWNARQHTGELEQDKETIWQDKEAAGWTEEDLVFFVFEFVDGLEKTVYTLEESIYNLLNHIWRC